MKTRGISERLEDFQEKAKTTAQDLGKVTDDCLRSNTWSALAVAAVAGCLLGYLLAPREQQPRED